MEGVECPYENAYFFFRGSTYSPARYINAIPRASGNDVIYFHDETEERNKFFLTKSPVADWFKNAKIVQKGSENRTTYTPIMEPVLGNILIVGDAAGSFEVEIHGALACGYKAGLSVIKAVNEGKGLEEYIDWWQNSIEYVRKRKLWSEYAEERRIRVSFREKFTDEEIDCLFKLIDDEMFPGLMNPFIMWERMADAFLNYQDVIQKEKPNILKKIEDWIGMSAKEFKASRSAFSYKIIR
jgi:flavin-dependent dehydrogenase